MGLANPGRVTKQASLWSVLIIASALLVAFTLSAWFTPNNIVFVQSWVPKSTKWVKPEGLKVVGLVFYGRPQFVSILDCYLKRNLASNGGFLDEVHWMGNTDNPYDLKYLNNIVTSSPEYKNYSMENLGYGSIWEHAKENGTLYIKIDDDIVYIHEDAIPRLVQTRLQYPDAFDIAANIVNSPLTDWFHHRTQAVYPYLPEPHPPPHDAKENTPKKPSWRPSELPLYEEDAPDEYEFGEKNEGESNYLVGQIGGPTYRNHRWLPLGDTAANLLKTPIAHSEYNAWGRGLYSWAIAAQQHYSIFENIEKDRMNRYWFGDADGIWNPQYDRYNLNFLAIWGQDVGLEDRIEDDERQLTVDFPFKHKRPLLIDTHAIISHFSFGPQKHEMMQTDLLERYRAYANEKVCKVNNQLKPMELHY